LPKHHVHNGRFATGPSVFLELVNQEGYEIHQQQALQDF
jgi:hypothetical protein